MIFKLEMKPFTNILLILSTLLSPYPLQVLSGNHSSPSLWVMLLEGDR
jgi:hypothetical protein